MCHVLLTSSRPSTQHLRSIITYLEISNSTELTVSSISKNQANFYTTDLKRTNFFLQPRLSSPSTLYPNNYYLTTLINFSYSYSPASQVCDIYFMVALLFSSFVLPHISLYPYLNGPLTLFTFPSILPQGC